MQLDNKKKSNDKATQQSLTIQQKHTDKSAYVQKSATHLQVSHHASLSVPVVTALVQAINNNYVTSFQGLTANGILKHLTEESNKDQSQEYLSQRKIQNWDPIVQAMVVKFEDQKVMKSRDKTGAFKSTSARGN